MYDNVFESLFVLQVIHYYTSNEAQNHILVKDNQTWLKNQSVQLKQMTE